MVPFKNVTGVVTPILQDVLPLDNTLDNATLGASGIQVQGYLEPMEPQETFADWGVLLNNPALLQVELSDAPSFELDYEFEITGPAGSAAGAYTGNVYKVRGRPNSFDMGMPADHADVLLDLMIWPNQAPPPQEDE